ncbi:hypothetical protein [Streptomyces brevispora]|uniref:Uncharacterized protein n=1 Tax=Streptomyces brevispora TaxID=887462 RepID=A0ABZ1GCP7_9ACTN|nr:hypothetical protein [Streptomyces brevispora]WSC17723.1 hypothetical protein OIE64_02650 [Streptomyces brevispora]
MTVHRFTKDVARAMKLACLGACLSKWPVGAPHSTGMTTRRHPGLCRSRPAKRSQAAGRRLPDPLHLLRRHRTR